METKTFFFNVDIKVKSGNAGLLLLWNWDYRNPDWYRQWGGSCWQECGKITAGSLRFCRSSLEPHLKPTWSGELKLFSQPCFIRTSETKKSIITPYNKAGCCCYFNFQWNSCFVVHLSAWRLSAPIIWNPWDSLSADHELILMPITCPGQSSDDRELPLELPKSDGFHRIFHHESIWKKKQSQWIPFLRKASPWERIFWFNYWLIG